MTNPINIHATPHKLVLAVTGGGAEIIGELLRYGDGSKTLLEAVVPYDTAALSRFLGGKPDKYCSPTTARDMAMAAYQHARRLAPDMPIELLYGVGATCSLAKAGSERAGRKHYVYIGLQTHDKTWSACIELGENRQRLEEEGVAADLIMETIALGCGLGNADGNLHRILSPLDRLSVSVARPESTDVYNVINGLTRCVTINLHPDQQLKPPQVLFPGSFNPPHERHWEITRHAYQGRATLFVKNLPVALEISVQNADKPSLNYHAISERLAWIRAGAASNPHIDRLYLTNLPTFKNKSEFFASKGYKNLSFLVGLDTICRVNDCKYAGNRESMLRQFEQMLVYGSRFIVFHRKDHPIPVLCEELKDLSLFVSVESSEDKNGLSSTQIRNSHGN